MNRQDLLNLIPAYALDALDDDERQQVEGLLVHDVEAQVLLRDYQQITEVLDLALPQHSPPAHLRDNLKARLKQPKKPENISISTAPKRPAHVLNFPIVALVSVAVIAVIIGIGVVLFQQPAINPSEVVYNDLIATDDFQSHSIIPDFDTEPIGQLVVSGDGTIAVLRIETLPALEDNQSYQLWTITEDGTADAGVFHWETGHGPYFVAVDPTIENLRAFGMTVEPEGGSPLGDEPSGTRLFAIEVAEAS